MIRLAQPQDLDRLLAIYAAARQFMRRNGNATQWSGNYPSAEDLLEDIRTRRLYAVDAAGSGLCACFMLADGPDPTYAEIFDGAWHSNTPYGVIHRVASDGTQHGILAQCIAFARERYDHLRIDTHADNHPMQHALLRQGFTHRGTIFIRDGSPRLAYDWRRK